MPTLYTMSSTTPGAWQQFLDVLCANPGMAIRDLRPLGDPPSQDEPKSWREIHRQLSMHEPIPSNAEYHYAWLGFFLFLERKLLYESYKAYNR